MGWEAPWHWVVLAIVVIALFGYKKLPDAARALGRSLRIFKTEIKGMSQDDAAREKKALEATPPENATPAAPAEPAAGPEAPPPADAELPPAPAASGKKEPSASE